MNPVSDTAFYTCGIRAQDAESTNPVCNDQYAKRFMNAHGKEVFARFGDNKMGSKAHLARHSMIDELVRARVSADPGTTIVTIGAGFDSRPYRIKGGRWIELDEPGIVEYKSERLATTECGNALSRISVDFSKERLSEKLPALMPAVKVVVVVEGVFFYLTETQVRETLNALRQAYPDHVLICDLMTREFIESRYRKDNHKKFQQMNAPFKFLVDAPSLTVAQAGYHCISEASIVTKALELRWNRGMASLIARIMRRMANGYKVHTFATQGDAAARSSSAIA